VVGDSHLDFRITRLAVQVSYSVVVPDDFLVAVDFEAALGLYDLRLRELLHLNAPLGAAKDLRAVLLGSDF
jgi:hypothetical protein